MINKFLYWIVRRITVTHVMIPFKNDYIYADYYGRLWKLRATGHNQFPFTIELMEQ